MYTQDEQLQKELARLNGQLALNDPQSLGQKSQSGLGKLRQWARASSTPLQSPRPQTDPNRLQGSGHRQSVAVDGALSSTLPGRRGETLLARAERHALEWGTTSEVQALDERVFGPAKLPKGQQESLAQGQADTRAVLDAFRQDPQWMSTLKTAMGDQWHPEQAQKLLKQLASGEGMPQIEVVPEGQLKGQAAYSEGKIWISQGFLAASRQHPQQLTEVLLEEVGHHLDSQLNRQDSLGDEGEIFSKLVREGQLSPAQLQGLKQENDHSIALYGGQTILVENFGWSDIGKKFSGAKKSVSSALSTAKKGMQRVASSPVNSVIGLGSDIKRVFSGVKDASQNGLTIQTFAPEPNNSRSSRRSSTPPQDNSKGSTPSGQTSPVRSENTNPQSSPSGSLLKYKPGRLMPSGSQVEKVQTDLKQLGYSLKVDGKYGSQSTAIVKQFQLDNGLKVDGIVGPNTRQAMQNTLSKSQKQNKVVKQDKVPEHYDDLTKKYLEIEQKSDNLGTGSSSASLAMHKEAGALREQQVKQEVKQISKLLHTDKQKWYTPWANGDKEVTAAELEEIQNILAGVDGKAQKAIYSRLTDAQKQKIETVELTGEFVEEREAKSPLASAFLNVAKGADQLGNQVAEGASKMNEKVQEGLDKGQRSFVNVAQSQADKFDGTFLENSADMAVDAIDQSSQVGLGVAKTVTSTVSDAVEMAANPDDFIKDMNTLGQQIIKNNPLDGLSEQEKEFYQNMGNAVLAPYKELAEEGRYGEIAGMGLGEILISAVGGAGVAAKVGKLPKISKLASKLTRNKPRNSLPEGNTSDLAKNLDNGLPDEKSSGLDNTIESTNQRKPRSPHQNRSASQTKSSDINLGEDVPLSTKGLKNLPDHPSLDTRNKADATPGSTTGKLDTTVTPENSKFEVGRKHVVRKTYEVDHKNFEGIEIQITRNNQTRNVNGNDHLKDLENQRKSLELRRKEAKTSQEKNHLSYQKGVISEEMGEVSTELTVRSLLGKDGHDYKMLRADLIGGGKNYEFDQIYQSRDGSIIIVEAKGGESPFGVKRDSSGQLVQQGTPEYTQATIDGMFERVRKHRESPDYGNNVDFTEEVDDLNTTLIRIDRTDPSKIHYVGIRQKVKTNGDIKPASEVKFFSNHSESGKFRK